MITRLRRFCFSLTTLAAVLAAPGAHALCTGEDQRQSLSSSARAEVEARIAQTPFASGNHWRATRGADVVHLVGTIHIYDPRLTDIAARLHGVVEASERMLVEITPDDLEGMKTKMASNPDLLFLSKDSLAELLPEADWQRLKSALQARGIPPMLGSRMQPWYLSTLLAMPPCLADLIADHPDSGLDHLLMMQARYASVPLSSLEPADTLFQVLGTKPLREQIKSLMMSLDSDLGSEDALQTLRAAYFDEAHAQAWEMARQQVLDLGPDQAAELMPEFLEMEAALLHNRNRAWIPVILDALNSADTITVAAGAGHLAGTRGLLALLQKEGFTLERLPF